MKYTMRIENEKYKQKKIYPLCKDMLKIFYNLI
jgi:hypothetical protein